jgi:hypothetical protein
MNTRRDCLKVALTASITAALPAASAACCKRRHRSVSSSSSGLPSRAPLPTPPALRGALIQSVLVHIHTTEDDKDYELSWDMYVVLDGKWIGRVLGFGAKTVWPNGDHRDVRLDFAWQYPFEERFRLSVLIIQQPFSFQPGWEGRVDARAILAGGTLEPVLADTGNFKLGESGNPMWREFIFNR